MSSYLVSISAAHSLETGALAIFFIGWTIESMWVGAVRMILVPALLLNDTVPRPAVLIAVGCALSIPLVAAVLLTSGDLPLLVRWLLALSVVTLGAYEMARSLLSRTVTRALALPLADAIVFFAALVGILLGALAGADGLTVALASLCASSALVTIAILSLITLGRRGGTFEPLQAWLLVTWPLLRLGGLEWIVFFVTSSGGLALLGLLGGPNILAGVRLAETLVAPIGLLSSALPFVVSSALRADPSAVGPWPRAVRDVWLLLTIVTVAYLAAIQFAPSAALRLLVGEHVEIARQASLGLALGVVASVFGATATLVMKHRRQVKTLARLRAVGLIVALPAVAIGASTGSVMGAGVGVSSSQLFPAIVQAGLTLRSKRSA
ncbi:hypothetical protein M3666_12675 [Curtobacterium sp. ODYSSEY 48 V2]|uniref:hypothetical protein n=1 Tax=Curtobacterium sp. ODYSSEY 48 V2 TaxID=2939561 RepID=UPI00203F19C6|nr:hypothetical protein [Curtobacterium sp. ODYSSEY 48 V2]MCM3505969.1 hypothetical protein [Curtobacterium sp. ODYSSEY 48 V2]